MADSLWMRLRRVRWNKYQISPAAKKQVPKMLENLASRKEPRAMKASHELWVALCSGQVYSAAEPCFPFLIEIMSISEPSVKGEILDLMTHFAQLADDPSAPNWHKSLRSSLKKQSGYFKKLSYNSDAIVADKATNLLGLL
jgi:hypothetical protein